MKKLMDLSGDEFLDILLSVSPIIPLILESEYLRSKYMSIHPDDMQALQARYRVLDAVNGGSEDAKQKRSVEKIALIASFNAKQASMIPNDVKSILPRLLSRENRDMFFDTMKILIGDGEIQYRVRVQKETTKAVKNEETGEMEAHTVPAVYEERIAKSIREVPGSLLFSVAKEALSGVNFDDFLHYAELLECIE